MPDAVAKARATTSWTHHVRAVLFLTADRFQKIDGQERAAAFAYYAFFALFPLLVLLVTVASAGLDQEHAGEDAIRYVESYLPISGVLQNHISATVEGVIKHGTRAGGLALIMLVWVAIQGFTTLIHTTNRAWGSESHNWWRLPLRSLVVLGIMTGAVVLGMTLPVLAKAAQRWLLPTDVQLPWMFDLTVGFLMPWLLVFLGLCLFYKLAPRRSTRLAEVWLAALATTALLRGSEGLFVIYLQDFATYDAIYGAFGGIMALLVWLYLSGSLIILGACFCAAQAETQHSADAA